MADIIDQANEAADVHLRAALSHRVESDPPVNGFCYNCGEDILFSESPWCDADCRDDWVKRREADANAKLSEQVID